jgi:fructokinase
MTIALVKSIETRDLTTIPHTSFEILHRHTILTTTPEETLHNTCSFFSKHRPANGFDSLGICTFGPVGVNPHDKTTFGRILQGSPKKDWRNVDILSPVLKACSSTDGQKQPAYKIDTDVNAPALAEFEYVTKTLNRPITSLAYITVGTGVGVGLVVNSQPVHGMMHPEGGHVPVVPLNGDDFAYSWGDKSPFRGRNTVEGIASSVALTERLAIVSQLTESSAFQNREGLKDLSDDHPVWEHAANALANLCVTLALVTCVENIVLGGGIMNRDILFDMVRQRTRELLNGYLDLPQITTMDGLREYIRPSIWKREGPGLVGALVLAQSALKKRQEGEETARMIASEGMRSDQETLLQNTLQQPIKNRKYNIWPHLALCSGGAFLLGLFVGGMSRRNK